MKLTPDCVPCLMKRVLFQARLLENGCESEAVGAALRAYAKEYAVGRNSAEVATEVHRSAYEVMGADPYIKIKLYADRIAEEYLDQVMGYVDSAEDRFSAAVRVAVIGNIMDFGVSLSSPEEFRAVFKKLLDQGIGSDDTARMKELLTDSKSVLYFFDNCGESQFDKLLIREIQRMGVRVVGVVRGERILNDVTIEDAERIGLDKILDRTVSTGTFAVGAVLSKAKDDLKEELDRADMMICKGMANYESLSDQDAGMPKVFILRTKCGPVARSLGVPENINVVRVAE
ncbi:damage-control phosphatase ARMT1 family protein [Candidatus Methanarcanum hacksteinii]|uniref:damage-control phosphatase ARMT1 family protein n=1 Tax=Candidatus Methanarcanum hacksteinii TaxID=2911857 RepID=UPI0037DD2FCF